MTEKGMIKIRRYLSLVALFFFSLLMSVSCAGVSQIDTSASGSVVLGYSSWPGWWPWAIAQEEGIFAANGANVELKWYDNYLESLEALANGELDANSQTLNDTVAFLPDSVNGQVVVLVNDNSAGNDKIIVTDEIDSIEDLKGKTVALEAGVVDDYLLSLALQESGLSRADVKIKNLETSQAAAAFVAGEADGVGAFPPFWLDALKRPGSHELLSSKDFPGAIPDLLVTSQTLVQERPDQVQALVNSWFDTLEFMEEHPERAQEIIARRANVSLEDFQVFDKGTKIFTIEQNIDAFTDGNTIEHMPLAAEKISEFLVDAGLLKAAPALNELFDDRFVQHYDQHSS